MNILDRFGTSRRCIALMCLLDGGSGSPILFPQGAQEHAEAAVTHHTCCLHQFTCTVSAQLEEETSFWVKDELCCHLLQPDIKNSANHSDLAATDKFSPTRCPQPTRLLPAPNSAVL